MKRKCRFTIETGPITADAFQATVDLLRALTPALSERMRADVRVACDALDAEDAPESAAPSSPSSRVIPNVRAPKGVN